MPASLVSTLSLITGPALLTNASAVLLLGATNRYDMAVGLRRHGLLSQAMLLLQLAVGCFGIATLAALVGLCVDDTIAGRLGSVATPVLLGAVAIGGASLIAGGLTMLRESWIGNREARA